MVENKSINESKDEIDLIDIFNKIGKWLGQCFKAIGRGILTCIAFLFHNFLILTISIVIGFIASYILRQAEQPLYEQEITLRNNVLENADMIEHINQLGSLISKKNIPEIASMLSIPENNASELVHLCACWIIDLNKDGVPDYIDYKNKHNPIDTVNVRMSDRFVVIVSSLDPMNIDYIKAGIIRYAKSHPLAETANNLRIKELNELIERTNIDIKELDSLQKVKYFEETRSRISEAGQIVLMQEQQTQMFYRDIQGLLSQRQAYEKELSLYPDVVTVISDFLPSSKRINTTFYYSKYSVPIAFCLAVILLVLLKQRRKIIEILNRY